MKKRFITTGLIIYGSSKDLAKPAQIDRLAAHTHTKYIYIDEGYGSKIFLNLGLHHSNRMRLE